MHKLGLVIKEKSMIHKISYSFKKKYYRDTLVRFTPISPFGPRASIRVWPTLNTLQGENMHTKLRNLKPII